MKKNLTSTLVLTFLLIATFGWYFGYEKNLKQTWEKKEENTKLVISLGADEIQELEITQGTAKPIKLKKSNERWLMLEPIQDDADSSAIQMMVATLTGIKQERVVDEKPQSLDVYGLNPPLIKILARKDSTKSEEIYVGKDTPVGFNSYAQIPPDNKVYKVTKSLKNSFEKDVTFLRNKVVAQITQADVTEVEIQNTENILLTKGDKEKWTLAREAMPVDGVEWNKTLNTLLEMKATAFAAEKTDNLAKYGLNKPLVKFWVKTAKEKPRTGIWLGKAGGKAYAKREDKAIIYEVDPTVFNTALHPSAAYRNTALAVFNRFDTKRIKLESGKNVVELLKDGNAWSLPAEPQTKVDEAQVDTLLTHLQDTKVLKFLPEAKGNVPLKNPSFIVRIFETAGGKEEERVTLHLGSVNSTGVLGSRNDLPFPFLMKTDDFKKIHLTKDAFVKKVDEKKSE